MGSRYIYIYIIGVIIIYRVHIFTSVHNIDVQYQLASYYQYMLANMFTASHSYPRRKPPVVVSHWIQQTGTNLSIHYRKKSTIHVGKHTVRPMDPSCSFRILLFEALLFFSKISGCIGQRFAKFDHVWHLLFVRRLRT